MKKLNIKFSKLVLGGDFFHVKASYLSANIAKISIPYYLSCIEEECVKVFFYF